VRDRVCEGLQVLVGLLQRISLLMVSDVLLECVAALSGAAGVKGEIRLINRLFGICAT